MRGNPSVQSTSTSVQHNPTSQINVGVNPVGVALTIALPVVVICAIVGYRKYRATVLRRRVKLLNQIWQLDALKKLS